MPYQPLLYIEEWMDFTEDEKECMFELARCCNTELQVTFGVGGEKKRVKDLSTFGEMVEENMKKKKNQE
jgi:hypothetical protein